jgi:hypothetical protein
MVSGSLMKETETFGKKLMAYNKSLIDWFIYWLIDWLIDWLINWLMDWLIDLQQIIDWLVDV